MFLLEVEDEHKFQQCTRKVQSFRNGLKLQTLQLYWLTLRENVPVTAKNEVNCTRNKIGKQHFELTLTVSLKIHSINVYLFAFNNPS